MALCAWRECSVYCAAFASKHDDRGQLASPSFPVASPLLWLQGRDRGLARGHLPDQHAPHSALHARRPLRLPGPGASSRIPSTGGSRFARESGGSACGAYEDLCPLHGLPRLSPPVSAKAIAGRPHGQRRPGLLAGRAAGLAWVGVLSERHRQGDPAQASSPRQRPPCLFHSSLPHTRHHQDTQGPGSHPGKDRACPACVCL